MVAMAVVRHAIDGRHKWSDPWQKALPNHLIGKMFEAIQSE
jgi:hypothetical protein